MRGFSVESDEATVSALNRFKASSLDSEGNSLSQARAATVRRGGSKYVPVLDKSALQAAVLLLELFFSPCCEQKEVWVRFFSVQLGDDGVCDRSCFNGGWCEDRCGIDRAVLASGIEDLGASRRVEELEDFVGVRDGPELGVDFACESVCNGHNQSGESGFGIDAEIGRGEVLSLDEVNDLRLDVLGGISLLDEGETRDRSPDGAIEGVQLCFWVRLV